MTRRLRGWLAAASVCAVAALGLPWSVVEAGDGSPAVLVGAASPGRVAVALGTVLVLGGLRRGRDDLPSRAVLAGVAGVLVGGPAPTPGRVALAVAVGCLVIGLRGDGRPVLPGARRADRAAPTR